MVENKQLASTTRSVITKSFFHVFPQGPLLGAMLFSIFVNDFAKFLKTLIYTPFQTITHF